MVTLQEQPAGAGDEEEKTAKITSTPTTLPTVASTSGSSVASGRDTGFQPKPKKRRDRDRDRSRDRGSRSGGTKPEVKSDAGRASAGKGKVRITIRDAAMATKAELRCPGSYRKRSGFSGRVATFTGVPGGSCTVHFFGPVPAKARGVKSGDSLTCSLTGSTAQCR